VKADLPNQGVLGWLKHPVKPSLSKALILAISVSSRVKSKTWELLPMREAVTDLGITTVGLCRAHLRRI